MRNLNDAELSSVSGGNPYFIGISAFLTVTGAIDFVRDFYHGYNDALNK